MSTTAMHPGSTRPAPAGVASMVGVPASGVAVSGVPVDRNWLAVAGEAIGQVVVPEQFGSEVEAQRYIADLDRIQAQIAGKRLSA
ncbi:hypothetical protein, partial [Kribbia dieselivorans]|uniref:hypothetical protein n=1 Tax=Kribbia dieselivorans TaxID=331526 RepID=UPI0012EE4F3D